MTADVIIKLIAQNPRLGLSKAITLLESSKLEDELEALKLLELIHGRERPSIRIGISGIPGVGKSTFIEAFGLYMLSLNKRVAVLTIDPSSPITGGSIMGDKTRMTKLANHPNAFIRPSPSKGLLGGVNAATRQSIFICEYSGFDIVIVETVGTGQSEISVSALTDIFVQLHMPSTGDELQGMKKGSLEVADVVIVTKADGHLLNAAKIAKSEIELAMAIAPRHTASPPKVILASGLLNTGIEDSWACISSIISERQSSGLFTTRRSQQHTEWLDHEIETQVVRKFKSHFAFSENYNYFLTQVKSDKILPPVAAKALINKIF